MNFKTTIVVNVFCHFKYKRQVFGVCTLHSESNYKLCFDCQNMIKNRFAKIGKFMIGKLFKSLLHLN